MPFMMFRKENGCEIAVNVYAVAWVDSEEPGSTIHLNNGEVIKVMETYGDVLDEYISTRASEEEQQAELIQGAIHADLSN